MAYLCGLTRVFPRHALMLPRCLTPEPPWACKTYGQARSQCLQGMQTDNYSATTVQHQHYGPLVCHRYNANRLDSTVPRY
jgi:hypothetical protein